MSSLPLLLTLTCRQSLRLAETFDPSITKPCHTAGILLFRRNGRVTSSCKLRTLGKTWICSSVKSTLRVVLKPRASNGSGSEHGGVSSKVTSRCWCQSSAERTTERNVVHRKPRDRRRRLRSALPQRSWRSPISRRETQQSHLRYDELEESLPSRVDDPSACEGVRAHGRLLAALAAPNAVVRLGARSRKCRPRPRQWESPLHR